MEVLFWSNLKSAISHNSAVAFANFAQLATIDCQVANCYWVFLVPISLKLLLLLWVLIVDVGDDVAVADSSGLPRMSHRFHQASGGQYALLSDHYRHQITEDKGEDSFLLLIVVVDVDDT